MGDRKAREFARCTKGIVVAPAGCGKTHLIAESVAYTEGKQLILTHTHAGVHSLRTKLKNMGIPAAKYDVTTIDSLALRYSNAFPTLAGWDYTYPSNDEDWRVLRTSANRLFCCRVPRKILSSSYKGVFVDEYQDCSGTQHAIVKEISKMLPCRIVGDPLQAIYRKLNKGDIARWHDIKKAFPIINELRFPHRWNDRNPDLGAWLSEVRVKLNKGLEVDLGNTHGIVNWISSADMQSQINACYRNFDKTDLIAIRGWHNQCAEIAGKTKNHFVALESVECPDLLKWAEKIGESKGLERIENIVRLSQHCFTQMSTLTELLDRLRKKAKYSPRSHDKAHLWAKMQKALTSEDLRYSDELMAAIEELSGSHFYKRRELWQEMRRTLKTHSSEEKNSLQESAWKLRDNGRKNGRRIITKRTVATPLLIKGLEFDHALLLNATEMETPEELYVALTRGSFSLTVLSNKRRLSYAIPAWVQESKMSY